MFVKTTDETYLHKRWNTQQVRRRDVFDCDECGMRYSLGHKLAHSTNGALTFCSKTCNKKSRANGKLAQQWKQTKLARYGVEFSSQVAGASEKMIASRLASTGASSPSTPTSSSNARFKRTMTERHGADHPLKAIGPKAKRAATVIKRFGKDPLAMPENRDCVKGGQNGYRALVMKRGDEVLSKPEATLTKWLRNTFGVQNVEQQAIVEHQDGKWLVDFYVKSIDTYIQLDGVFWHGLNKTYEELHPRSRAMYDKDRVQDVWFANHGKKLIRVTDQLLIQCQKKKNFSDIMEKFGG